MLDQLHKWYGALAHMQERFEEIVEDPDFADISGQLLFTGLEIDGLVTAAEQIYSKLQQSYTMEQKHIYIALLEEDFNEVRINGKDTGLRNIFLLTYLRQVRHLISSAYQTMLFLEPLEDIADIITKQMNWMPGNSLTALLTQETGMKLV